MGSYKYYNLNEIIEDIQIQINHNTELSDISLKYFKDALNTIQKSQIYIHRIDNLLSGDDSEETFLEKIKNDLNNDKK